MPRTIYQRDVRTYIGDRISQNLAEGTYGPVARLIPSYQRMMQTYATYQAMVDNPLMADSWSGVLPVYDREVNSWVRLNVEDLMVDYAIRELRHNRADIVWKWSWDYQRIRIYLNTEGQPEQKFEATTKVGTDGTYRLSNLTPTTEYEVNVIADVPWGVTTSHRQKFRTPANPIPLPPTNLRYTIRTNHSITLQWGASENATSYAVYQAVEWGGMQRIAIVDTTVAYLGLNVNTRYRFMVVGINADGLAGPSSNEIRSATGHDEERRTGYMDRFQLAPHQWGSWRSDIGWNWWYVWPEKDANLALYQGYYQYQYKRYWAVIEYDPGYLSWAIDSTFGPGVANRMAVTEASIRRLYRQERSGNRVVNDLWWHLSQTQVRADNNQPSTYGDHANFSDGPDSLAWQRGLNLSWVIDFYRIPRDWGYALVNGHFRSLCMNRMDNQNTGVGYAGYSKISGHLQPDYFLGSQGWRYSDLSLCISANWDYFVAAYTPPYDW